MGPGPQVDDVVGLGKIADALGQPPARPTPKQRKGTREERLPGTVIALAHPLEKRRSRVEAHGGSASLFDVADR